MLLVAFKICSTDYCSLRWNFLDLVSSVYVIVIVLFQCLRVLTVATLLFAIGPSVFPQIMFYATLGIIIVFVLSPLLVIFIRAVLNGLQGKVK